MCLSQLCAVALRQAHIYTNRCKRKSNRIKKKLFQENYRRKKQNNEQR